ncbi:MAG: hypothetical protein GY757_39215 [bacterium]|nr:hypothetical protein [bacterium]
MGKKVLEGLTVSGGSVSGKVRVVTNLREGFQVEEGEILVLPKSHPGYAVGVMKAGGLICEQGGVLAHICVVALEMGIPCITQAANAIEIMKTKERVRLDADEGVVYED